MDILALLQPINGCLSITTLRQMSRIILAMLAMTGRETMLGLSRWAGEGGSYRTIQRFYQTAIPWTQLIWKFFSQSLWQKDDAYYSLRFQLEFNFRDAKQLWGLEDFVNVNQNAVTNAAQLSPFMVNVSQLLMSKFRQSDPDFSVLDLKANFRGRKYATELLKMLPQKPDAIFVSQLFQRIATLGSIHTAKLPVSSG